MKYELLIGICVIPNTFVYQTYSSDYITSYIVYINNHNFIVCSQYNSNTLMSFGYKPNIFDINIQVKLSHWIGYTFFFYYCVIDDADKSTCSL